MTRTLAGCAACGAVATGLCALGPLACGGPTGANADGGAIVVHGDPYGDSGCDPTQAPIDEPCVLADAYGVFVAPPSSGGSDTGDGSMAHPFATIGKALSTGSANVFVCDGTYPENVSVTAPVRLYAGLSCASDGGTDPWAYSGGVATVSAPTAASPALAIVDAGDAAISIADLAVISPDQPVEGWDPSTGDGTSSIAALIANSTVTFTRVTLAAGAGSNGAAGADGVTMTNYPIVADGGADPAPPGMVASCSLVEAGIAGAAGGSIVCANGTTSQGGSGGSISASPLMGSSGASGAPIVAGANEGDQNDAGANEGDQNDAGANEGDQNDAGANEGDRNGQNGAGGSLADAADPTAIDAECSGAPGADGLSSPGGAPATVYGSLSASGWTPSPGENGPSGGTGQGGGGGSSYAIDLLGSPDVCGGTGGSAGGCGGTGGSGGRGGGASIALASVDSIVVLASCTLTAGRGGDGGNGGAGQNGQAGGGVGGVAPDGKTVVAPCAGGAGGSGAGGSGGAGGTGGLSAGIVFTGAVPSVDSATVIRPGIEGLPGQPGSPGAHGTNTGRKGVTTGNDGGVGALGLGGAAALILGL